MARGSGTASTRSSPTSLRLALARGDCRRVDGDAGLPGAASQDDVDRRPRALEVVAVGRRLARVELDLGGPGVEPFPALAAAEGRPGCRLRPAGQDVDRTPSLGLPRVA